MCCIVSFFSGTGCIDCWPCDNGTASNTGVNCSPCQPGNYHVYTILPHHVYHLGQYSERGWGSCKFCENGTVCR